jgi:hypothetical protein
VIPIFSGGSAAIKILASVSCTPFFLQTIETILLFDSAESQTTIPPKDLLFLV